MPQQPLNAVSSGLIACFACTWIVLFCVNAYVLFSRRDATFKRKWFRRMVVLMSGLFVFFVVAINASSGVQMAWPFLLCVLFPIVILIAWLNLKLTRFCDHCGATILPGNFFVRPKYCPRCGTPLDAMTKADAEGFVNRT
jgi:FtsH-binding integral membrane protein